MEREEEEEVGVSGSEASMVHSDEGGFVTPFSHSGTSSLSATPHPAYYTPKANHVRQGRESLPCTPSPSFMEIAGRYHSPIIIPALQLLEPSEDPPPEKEEEEALLFPTDVLAHTLIDAVDYPPQYLYSVTGRVKKRRGKDEIRPGVQVFVNGRNVALFKYKGSFFAVEDRCSHQGGPLHVGDIEELDGRPCVSCPYHGFSFDLSTGMCVAPRGSYKQAIYSVRVQEDGTLAIGFPDGINSSVFSSHDF